MQEMVEVPLQMKLIKMAILTHMEVFGASEAGQFSWTMDAEL